MRIDIRHLVLKGNLAKVLQRVETYVATMAGQGKPVERIIVKREDYDAIYRKAIVNNAGKRVVLCYKDALVYFNHDEIDETSAPDAPLLKPIPKYDLPPVAANPFGVAAPVKTLAPVEEFDQWVADSDKPVDDQWPDDDIPF